MKKVILLRISFFVLLVFIDQIFKYSIRHFGGFYICNAGMTWGIKMPEFLLLLLDIIILICVFCFSLRKDNKNIATSVALVLILAGGISNFVDRIYFGCVIDFIDLKFWPIFNPADIFISIGGLIWIANKLKIWYNFSRLKKK